MNNTIEICLIGSGNVAYHLCAAFTKAQNRPVQLYGRNVLKVAECANQFGIPFTNDLTDITPGADLYIIAVSDHAIKEVAHNLVGKIPDKSTVVHCSGAVPSSVLTPFFKDHGVFYPLQTLSKEKEANFEHIPICVFGSSDQTIEKLIALGQKISEQVHQIDDQQRAILHIAAVFANNFSNHLFRVAHDLLQEYGLDFKMLVPLIQETARKIEDLDPEKAQTGPALRGDENTINSHLDFLKNHPEARNIYRLLTHAINPELKR